MEPLQEDGAESVLVKLAQLKEQQAQLRQVILLLLASRSLWVWLLGPPGASARHPDGRGPLHTAYAHCANAWLWAAF